jgi:two-component system, chemotaxis family, protein-glutamate methylesterase/glutaminase
MNAAPFPTSAASPAVSPIRVMVVDDAIVVRGILSRWINDEADLQTVAVLRSGREALEELERADPDVVVLDIQMPELDGIAALPLLLEKRRNLAVIVVSSLTRAHAELSLKALALGAADCVPKPDSNTAMLGARDFRRELIDKIRALGSRRRSSGTIGRNGEPGVAAVPRIASPPISPQEYRTGSAPFAGAVYKLRPFSLTAPRILVIGASTGGPPALMNILARLNEVTHSAPVLITQHMPPTFTTILAEHLARTSRRPTREPAHGETVRAGNIYLAPGGRHMRVERQNGTAVIALDDGPPINYCKPAVDPLFSSAAQVWGSWVLAVILTGMGNDGTGGAGDIVAASGSVIAQDEASSVVWGMPGSAVQAGLCSAVLPLDAIGPKIVRLFAGERQ